MSDLKEALAVLTSGRDLAPEAMERAVGTIMDGEASPVAIAAFLTALCVKGETAAELAAAARALRARAVRVEVARTGQPLIDTCGTGGDGLGTFNVSTAAAFVAAAGGARVAKHGNRAASGKVGAADVLEAAGVTIDVGPEDAARAIEKVGIAFLFAPRYHPAFRHVAPVRRELGFRTMFNLMGPLVNPAGASRQVIGLYAAAPMETVAQALVALGCEHALVVHGQDGSDEITPAATTDVIEVQGGATERYRLDPADFGIERCAPAELAGGKDAAESAAILREVLAGKPGARADAVALNAGAALYVAGIADSLAAGVVRARELVTAGAGLAKLDALVAFKGS